MRSHKAPAGISHSPHSGGWKDAHRTAPVSEEPGYKLLAESEEDVEVDARKRAWTRLLTKLYEVDPFVCRLAARDNSSCYVREGKS